MSDIARVLHKVLLFVVVLVNTFCVMTADKLYTTDNYCTGFAQLCFMITLLIYNVLGEVACRRTPLTFVDSMAEIFSALLCCIPLWLPDKELMRNGGMYVTCMCSTVHCILYYRVSVTIASKIGMFVYILDW